jgi:hypothetical protein
MVTEIILMTIHTNLIRSNTTHLNDDTKLKANIKIEKNILKMLEICCKG